MELRANYCSECIHYFTNDCTFARYLKSSEKDYEYVACAEFKRKECEQMSEKKIGKSITEEMIKELNKLLEDRGAIFRYTLTKNINDENMKASIVPANSVFLNYTTINITKDFKEFLIFFFKERGIENLAFNNDLTIMWSNDFWFKQ